MASASSTNFSVERDSNVNTQTSSESTRVPRMVAPLPILAYSEQGNVAFDTTVRQLAYFDGLVWVYLSAAVNGVTDIINIGGGAQVFESFNPNVPGNKVARLRTILGAGGITVTQQATTITVDDGGENITDITNVGGGAEVFSGFNPNLPGNKNAELRTFVAGDGISIVENPTTIEISADEAEVAPYFIYQLDQDVVVPEQTEIVLITPNVTWTLVDSNVGASFNNGIFTASPTQAGNWQFGVKGAFAPISVESNGASGLSGYYNFPSVDFVNNIQDESEITSFGYRLVNFGVRMASGDTMRFTANNTGTGAGSKTLLGTGPPPTTIRCWGFRTSI